MNHLNQRAGHILLIDIFLDFTGGATNPDYMGRSRHHDSMNG
ncbi:hypothetical protein [Bacterioplanoides sp.]